MKPILIAILCFFSLQIIHAQDDKTVTLTVSGTGKTLEEAKNNALRSAIEQAFGAYISSKTEILNDNLIKDEIVSVANGNIQKFDIISQVEIPNNGYAMTLNATVSISKLTSFAQSKGVSIEIKGGLFAANIIQQELNENAELKAVENILNTSNEILKKSFDYSIETKGNPTLNNGKYEIPLKISIKVNKNFYEFTKYFISSLYSLSMSDTEIANYEEIKKSIGQIIILKGTYIDYDDPRMRTKTNYAHIYTRNIESIKKIDDFLVNMKYEVLNFNANSNLHSFSTKEILKDTETVINSNAKIVLFYATVGDDYSRKYFCDLVKEYFSKYSSICPFKYHSINMILQFLYFNKNNEIANIDFVDTKSLEEIKQLSEYKIKPKE